MERRDPLGWLSWAFPAGTLAGVRVFVHWSFPFFLLTYSLVEGGRYGAEWGWKVALSFAALYAIVLLHEFGHVFAGRREGIDAERVTLWPLGGLAALGEEAEGSAEVRISAAGPAVNVAFLVLFLPLFSVAGIRIGIDFLDPFRFWPTPADGGIPGFGQELLYLVAKLNLICLLFNLLPAFPMDGGRILRGLLHRRMGRVPSTIAVTTVALVVAGGLLVWAVLRSHLLLAFIAVSVGFGAFLTRRRALAFLSEFGGSGFYPDPGFSSDLAPSRELAREEEKERRRREEQAARERETEARVDELLDKIHREGMESLTRRERAFLEEASRRKR